MKPQAQNRSFIKYLTAVAAFLLTCTAALGQQPQLQWRSDGCLYSVVANRVIPRGQPGYLHLVRQGCNIRLTDGRVYYRDDTTGTFRDVQTGYLYVVLLNGRWGILTTNGWTDAQQYWSGLQWTLLQPTSILSDREILLNSASIIGGTP